MREIVACFKWVIDEAYIRRGPGGDLDLSAVNYKISDYDRNAIEEAVRLKEKCGGSITAVTVGVPEATRGIKDALSMGADRAVFIADALFAGLEPSQTASVLSEAIRAGTQFDLILCGEGSSDLYAQQVGPRLAEKLGIPCICYVQKLDVEGDLLTAERRVEEGVEVVEAKLPALVTVLPDINTPRIPGVKDTLTASKKPVVTVTAAELKSIAEARLKTTGITAFRMERSCERFGTDDKEITRFVGALRKKGVI